MGLLQVGTASESSAHAACDCSSSHATDVKSGDICQTIVDQGTCDCSHPEGPTGGCLVSCGCVAEASQKRCRSSGDPHYTSWNDKQFDFMGIGTYRLAAAPLTRCGCDMDVQTFTAPSDLLSKGGHSTGSSNVALAARFGTVLITILGSDRSIHIHDASTGTDVPMTWDEWGSSDQKDALEAKYGIRQRGASLKNGKPRNSRGWRVAVPGGGARASRPMRPAAHFLPSLTRAAPSLLRVSGELLAMITEHAIVSIWLTLPGDSLTSQVPPRRHRLADAQSRHHPVAAPTAAPQPPARPP